MGERNGDRSGSRAYVDDLKRRIAIEPSEDSFDEVLGLRPRDEDCRRYAESETVELLFAGDVLDGLIGKAALDEVIVGILFIGRQGAVGFRVESGTRDTEEMQEQQDGVAMRFSAKIWGGFELVSGSDDGFAESRRGSSQCEFSVASIL